MYLEAMDMAVTHKVDDLLADGVVATRIVVGGVLLARDQLLRVVQLAVLAGADLVDDGRLEVNEPRWMEMTSRCTNRGKALGQPHACKGGGGGGM